MLNILSTTRQSSPFDGIVNANNGLAYQYMTLSKLDWSGSTQRDAFACLNHSCRWDDEVCLHPTPMQLAVMFNMPHICHRCSVRDIALTCYDEGSCHPFVWRIFVLIDCYVRSAVLLLVISYDTRCL